jgi:hypothetical protein
VASVVVQPAGKVFVAGVSSSLGWVGALSPCTGELEATRTVTLAGATKSGAKSIALSGNDLFVVGSAAMSADPLEGMAARLEASTLTVLWANPLPGSSESDEGWGVGVAANGSLWMAGASQVESGAKPWAIKGNASGAACGFTAVDGAGLARAVTVNAGDAYVAGAIDSAGFVARFDTSSCTTTSPCSCSAAWQSDPIAIGATYTEVRAIEVVGGTLYVGGFALDDGSSHDYEAFVARVDAVGGGVLGAWTWNPTAEFDAVLGMDSDGQRVYIAMISAYDGATASTAKAYVEALPMDITAATSVVWAAELPFMRSAWNVAVDPSGSDGLFVVGRSETSGWVARCTNDGVCPQ